MTNYKEVFLGKIMDDSYVEWITLFTKKYNKLKQKHLPQNTRLEHDAIVNFKLLRLFYEVIIKYLDDAYKTPVLSYYGSSFVLEYKNNYIMFNLEEMDVTCVKLENYNQKKFINYSSLKNYIIENINNLKKDSNKIKTRK